MNLQLILGNFALILFILMVVTGIIWFLDIFVFSKQRRATADAALAAIEAALLRQPTWIEYSGAFFPVIALVFFLRSFLYEPFKIPSSSMVPTLLVGDLILVNKFD